MESMIRYPLIEELLDKASAQVVTLQGLAGQMEREAERMRRHDLAGQLRALAGAVAQEVRRACDMELASESGFTEGRLIGGAVNFAIGSLLAWVSGSRKHPLRVGARMAGDCLSKTSPFGEVLVAVATKGTREDRVKVIALSRMARESGTTEAQARATLQSRGRLLLTPEEFSEVIEKKVHDVLEGKLDLSASDDRYVTVAAADVDWKTVRTSTRSSLVSQGSQRIV